MEILLSKVIPLLIYPVGLVFCLLALALLLFLFRRPIGGKVLVVLAVALIFAAGNSWTAYTLIRGLEAEYRPMAVEDAPDADVIVVLGGGISLPHPPRLYPNLSSSSDRLLRALRLYRAGKADHILLTGGNVFPQPGLEGESFYARELLELWGVPPSAVVIETESRNTIQNAELSAPILRERGWDKVLLVTSATHMYRAELAFRHAGIDVIPVPVDFIAVDASAPGIFNWIPSAGAMSGTTHALHEHLGRLWYRWRL